MFVLFYCGMFVFSALVIMLFADVVFRNIDIKTFKKYVKSKYGLNFENVNESKILEQLIIHIFLAFGSFKLICDSQWGWIFVAISMVLMVLAETDPLP